MGTRSIAVAVEVDLTLFESINSTITIVSKQIYILSEHVFLYVFFLLPSALLRVCIWDDILR